MEETSAKNFEFHKLNFSKADFWRAIIAGEAIALLVLPVLKNLGFFKIWFLAPWVICFPFLTVGGLYVFYRIALLKWPILYQIGKYGIVGWLNLFVVAGVLNFLMYTTGITEGLWIDVFFVVVFTLAITNSFYWNKFWTFTAGASKKTRKEYIKFLVVSSVVALINTGLMHLLINTIGAPDSIDAKVWANMAIGFLIPVSFFGNFLGYKFFVFKAKFQTQIENVNG